MLISLPPNIDVPNEASFFTPEENLIMILVGIKAVNIMKDNYRSSDCDDIMREYETLLDKKNCEISAFKIVYNEIATQERDRVESRIEELVNIEKQKNSIEYKDIIEKCGSETLEYQKTVEKLKNDIIECKKETSSLEIALIKKEEFIRHLNIVNDLRIENDVNMKVKMKEDEVMKELQRCRELLNTAEKTLILNENTMLISGNEKVQALQTELSITKDNLNNLLMQKERETNLQLNETIQTNNKSIDEITSLLKCQTTNKSNVRGAEGESYFFNLALNTFCDCANFEIEDKSKTPHCGDFWLKFDRFTIMVDSKNYVDTPVPSRDRLKLKNDILFNKNIKIAWLVSMDQPILTYSSYPFMIDVDGDVCYCYINSLMKSESPTNLLRMAWYACNFVFDHLLNIDNDTQIISRHQKNESRIKNILNKMLTQSKERGAILNQLAENFKSAESDIRDCLNDEIRDIRERHVDIISSWFNQNAIKKEGGKMKTTDMHKKFISNKDNKNQGIDADMFKQIIRSMKEISDNDIIRGKTDKAQYIINGYVMKD